MQTSEKPEVTKVGNAGSDPELRFTPAGKAVCNFSLAVEVPTARKENGQPDWSGPKRTDWYEVAVWDQMAENVAQSITKGCRLIVVGRGEVEEYEKDGETRSRKKITATAVGADLRWATCTVVKPERTPPTVVRTVPEAYDDEPF